jgi:hypothetical protein
LTQGLLERAERDRIEPDAAGGAQYRNLMAAYQRAQMALGEPAQLGDLGQG